MDYDGTFIKHFISIDDSWLESYAEFICENLEYSNSHIHERLLACWDLDNYIRIFDYLFNYVVDKEEVAEWTAKYVFSNILVNTKEEGLRAERQEQWILHVIKNSTDSKKIIACLKHYQS